jgi:hypothetical protein
MVGKPSVGWVVQVAKPKGGYVTRRRVGDRGNALRVFRETNVKTKWRKRVLSPLGEVVVEYTGPVSSRG